LESIFINPKGVGKRMVVDRQKGQNQITVQEVQSGRQARGQGRQKGQAGGCKVQKQARVKTRRTRKRRNAKSRRTGKLLDDLETYKLNWHRETGNTGINTLGKISDTWRVCRQSQGQVKQIRA
jgi:hypothetical protein